jgi:hypothetical protein
MRQSVVLVDWWRTHLVIDAGQILGEARENVHDPDTGAS